MSNLGLASPWARGALLTALWLASPVVAAPGPAGCGTGSWIAGSVEICDGVLVYSDYVYDDYGATVGDPSAESPATLGPTNGQVRYTADLNSADLVRLHLWIDGAQLRVRFELNTMRDTDSTFAALAIDTDDDAATGGGIWADLAAVEQPHGSGTNLVPLTSTGWDELHLFETGDPATNLIEGAIPLPPGDTWRIQAATGIKSRRVVMNVAFRGGIEDAPPAHFMSGLWFEERQADALTLGDISQFGAVVDVSQLAPGIELRAPGATGYHQRVYESDITVAEAPDGSFVYDSDAEGIDYEGIPSNSPDPQTFKFFGKYQPYGIYIPTESAGPYGLQLVMHGRGTNHASLVNQPGVQQDLGEALHRIVVVPLGRGPAGGYVDASERDVLDVMTDVQANYDIDPEKIFAGGYSMGCHGTYRLAAFYPHLFAGFLCWVGPGESIAPRGVPIFDFLGNLRHVPGAMLYGGADELVPINVYFDLRGRLDALGYEHILYLHPTADHLTFAVADDWAKEAAWSAGRTRETQPKRVTYLMEPFTWTEEIGIRHDRAYWVRDIRGVNTGQGDRVEVDVTTSGCGGSLPVTTRTVPDPAGTAPVAWTALEYLTTGQTPIAVAPHIEATLTNVASLEIDTSVNDGACLAGQQITYEITTDGPGQFGFSDGGAIDMPAAGIYTGTLPEPGALGSLAAGLLLVAGLARRRRDRGASSDPRDDRVERRARARRALGLGGVGR